MFDLKDNVLQFRLWQLRYTQEDRHRPVESWNDSSTRHLALSPSSISSRAENTHLGNRNHQLLQNTGVNLEFRMSLQILPHSSLRIVTRPPWPIGRHVCTHVFNHGVEDHTLTTDCDERCICLQFHQHVIMGVIEIEANQNPLITRCNPPDLVHDLRVDAGPFDHLNSRWQCRGRRGKSGGGCADRSGNLQLHAMTISNLSVYFQVWQDASHAIAAILGFDSQGVESTRLTFTKTCESAALLSNSGSRRKGNTFPLVQ